jgi:hypothetical protein
MLLSARNQGLVNIYKQSATDFESLAAGELPALRGAKCFLLDHEIALTLTINSSLLPTSG